MGRDKARSVLFPEGKSVFDPIPYPPSIPPCTLGGGQPFRILIESKGVFRPPRRPRVADPVWPIHSYVFGICRELAVR